MRILYLALRCEKFKVLIWIAWNHLWLYFCKKTGASFTPINFNIFLTNFIILISNLTNLAKKFIINLSLIKIGQKLIFPIPNLLQISKSNPFSNMLNNNRIQISQTNLTLINNMKKPVYKIIFPDPFIQPKQLQKIGSHQNIEAGGISNFFQLLTHLNFHN